MIVFNNDFRTMYLSITGNNPKKVPEFGSSGNLSRTRECGEVTNRGKDGEYIAARQTGTPPHQALPQ